MKGKKGDCSGSDYQPAGIDYSNTVSITWTNLRALDRMFRGLPAYPVGRLTNGPIHQDKDNTVLLDWDYLHNWLIKYDQDCHNGRLSSESYHKLRQILGSSAKSFIDPVNIDSWTKQDLLTAFHHRMVDLAPFMKFQTVVQTVQHGTVIGGRNDPGRGKTLEDWAGNWLKIN